MVLIRDFQQLETLLRCAARSENNRSIACACDNQQCRPILLPEYLLRRAIWKKKKNKQFKQTLLSYLTLVSFIGKLNLHTFQFIHRHCGAP